MSKSCDGMGFKQLKQFNLALFSQTTVEAPDGSKFFGETGHNVSPTGGETGHLSLE